MMKHFILIAIVVIGLLLVGCAQYEPLPGAEQDDSTAGSAVAYNYPISVTELGEGFTFTRGDSQVIWPAIDVAYTDMNVSDVAGIGYIYGNFDHNYYINPNSDRFARYIGLQTRYKSLNDLVFSAGKSYRFVYIPSDVTIQYTEPTQCQDALDNDGDGLVDLDDPGCTGAADNDEYNDPASDSWTDDFSQDGDAVFGDLGIYISLPDGYQYGSGLGVDMRDSSQFSASFKGGKGVRVEGDLAISGTAYSQTAYTEDLVVAEINPRRDDPVHVKGDLSVHGTICDGLGNCLSDSNNQATSNLTGTTNQDVLRLFAEARVISGVYGGSCASVCEAQDRVCLVSQLHRTKDPLVYSGNVTIYNELTSCNQEGNSDLGFMLSCICG